MAEKRPDFSGLGKVLQKAIQDKSGNETLPEDFNTLVLPNSQDIETDRILWTWMVCEDVPPYDGPEDPRTYLITGELRTKGATKGSYSVGMCIAHGDNTIDIGTVNFAHNEAKDVGRALISAWNYHNVWKDHAGYFIEKEVMDDGE